MAETPVTNRRKLDGDFSYETYSYLPSFVTKILAAMVQDRTFVPGFQDCLQPTYFDAPDQRLLAAVLLAYFDARHATPSVTVLRQMVHEYEAQHPQQFNVGSCDRLIDDMFDLDLSGDLDELRERAATFGKRQAHRLAMARCQKLLPEGDWDQIAAIMAEAGRVGLNRLDLPVWGDDYDAFLAWKSAFEVRRVPLGIPVLDQAMGGGVGWGEVVGIFGPTNTGKTTLAIHTTKAAAQCGYRTAYFTLESSADKLRQRYLCAILESTPEELVAYPQDMRVRLARLAERMRRMTVFKFLPPYESTLLDVRRQLDLMRREMAFVPDRIVIDSPDFLQPTSTKDDSIHARETEIYNMVSAMANELMVNVVTLSDVKQSALKKKRIEIEDLGGAYGKRRRLEWIITLAQPPEDKAGGWIRGYMPKGRDAASGQEFQMKVDYAKQAIQIGA